MVVVAVRFGCVEVLSGIFVVAATSAVFLLVEPLQAEELTDFLSFPRGMTIETNKPSLHMSRWPVCACAMHSNTCPSDQPHARSYINLV